MPCSCSQQLGGVLQEAGKLEDALLHFESAVSLNFKVFGGVHKRTLMSMNDLASLFYEMGRLEKALPLYVTVVAANRELLGVRHGDYLAVLFNLAQLQYHHNLFNKSYFENSIVFAVSFPNIDYIFRQF